MHLRSVAGAEQATRARCSLEGGLSGSPNTVVRTEGERRGMTYFAAGGGGGPARATVARKGKRKAAKRGAKKAKAAGPKALVVEVAAAA